MSPRERSTTDSELDSALATVDSFQSSIQHADTKVGVLLGAHGAVGMYGVGAFAHMGEVAAAGRTTTLLAGTLTMAFVVGLAFAAYHLIDALRPRLRAPDGPNRFAFPTVAASRIVPPPGGTGRQRDEVWQLAGTLARIAMAKHRSVHRSLPWIGVTAVATLGWTALQAWISS
jgi:hypothetical protein